MKTLLLSCLASLALAAAGHSTAQGAPPAALSNSAPPVPVESAGPVYVFPLKDQVSKATVALMRRALKEAERAGAGAFVIDMDTPGGSVGAMMDILELLQKTKLETVTYVNPNAISAGALIALGTKKIYMRSDAVIGAAAVVTSQGDDLGSTMQSKASSVITARLRAICEENGHNPAIADAFVIKEQELKVGDKVLDSKDTLLSLNASEAARLYDGKPLLAVGIVPDLAALAEIAQLSATLVTVEPTGFETIASWIAMFAPLLLVGGIAGAYIEFKTPGFGVPGILSLICFALFFGGHAIAGFAGYEVVFIFILGLALVIVEVFVIPGMIVPGLVGMLLMMGSILWAMVDRWPGTTGIPAGADLQTPMLNLVISILGTAVVLAALAKILPKTPLYGRLVLSTESPEGPAVSIPMVNLAVKTGDTGTATTVLRPAGKASFDGKNYDVVTLGDFLPEGTAVRVVESDGVRVVVEQA